MKTLIPSELKQIPFSEDVTCDNVAKLLSELQDDVIFWMSYLNNFIYGTVVLTITPEELNTANFTTRVSIESMGFSKSIHIMKFNWNL